MIESEMVARNEPTISTKDTTTPALSADRPQNTSQQNINRYN